MIPSHRRRGREEQRYEFHSPLQSQFYRIPSINSWHQVSLNFVSVSCFHRAKKWRLLRSVVWWNACDNVRRRNLLENFSMYGRKENIVLRLLNSSVILTDSTRGMCSYGWEAFRFLHFFSEAWLGRSWELLRTCFVPTYWKTEFNFQSSAFFFGLHLGFLQANMSGNKSPCMSSYLENEKPKQVSCSVLFHEFSGWKWRRVSYGLRQKIWRGTGDVFCLCIGKYFGVWTQQTCHLVLLQG